jgi:8-oxo-dGTP pyrophosphatase MutT (NUDIX family)
MHVSPLRIRPLAICVIQRGEDILVAEGYDRVKVETFYRPLGGGMEFGVSGEAAAVRELREELGVDVFNVHYLGTLENIYVYNGRPGHEIVLVYAAEVRDDSVYASEIMTGREDDGTPFHVVWKSLASFGPGSPLYPDGLLELLA